MTGPNRPKDLVDHIEALVQSVQSRAATDTASENAISQLETVAIRHDPVCPECGKPMVLRTARRGANAGNRFWGCSPCPACKGIVEFTNPNAS